MNILSPCQQLKVSLHPLTNDRKVDTELVYGTLLPGNVQPERVHWNALTQRTGRFCRLSHYTDDLFLDSRTGSIPDPGNHPIQSHFSSSKKMPRLWSSCVEAASTNMVKAKLKLAEPRPTSQLFINCGEASAATFHFPYNNARRCEACFAPMVSPGEMGR